MRFHPSYHLTGASPLPLDMGIFLKLLIDRVPEELWTEVHDIVQETGIKTIPMEKKCKKAKWFSEEALQIAEKRGEAKGKGKKERYTRLNAYFQRLARRDKVFLSDQCKEIEENDRMGKEKSGRYKKYSKWTCRDAKNTMLEVSNRAHPEDKAGGLEARSGHQPERHATGEVWARGSATSGAVGQGQGA